MPHSLRARELCCASPWGVRWWLGSQFTIIFVLQGQRSLKSIKIISASVEDLYQLLWTGHLPPCPGTCSGPMAEQSFVAMTLQDSRESTHDTGETLKKTFKKSLRLKKPSRWGLQLLTPKLNPL